MVVFGCVMLGMPPRIAQFVEGSDSEEEDGTHGASDHEGEQNGVTSVAVTLAVAG